jgi:hypothetical protein
MKRKVGDAGVEDLRPGEPPAKINSRWTNEELLMAVTAVRKYGESPSVLFMAHNNYINTYDKAKFYGAIRLSRN